ncbi:hypothetical protein DFS34DRAFT_506630 [Phlyctochytrium arcticum]|nr:hypothetical protein DFS34DRAFT_506630 [Phlyctochytrium arcticum]
MGGLKLSTDRGWPFLCALAAWAAKPLGVLALHSHSRLPRPWEVFEGSVECAVVVNSLKNGSSLCNFLLWLIYLFSRNRSYCFVTHQVQDAANKRVPYVKQNKS